MNFVIMMASFYAKILAYLASDFCGFHVRQIARFVRDTSQVTKG